MAQAVAFRFDIDTHKCMRSGVPSLLELANKYEVRFTFYANLGRAVSRQDQVMERLHLGASEPSDTNAQVSSLTAFRKLGLQDYLIAGLLNPSLGRYGAMLRHLADSNHELGLHGGRNHEQWSRHSGTWDLSKVRMEIQWSLARLRGWVPKFMPYGFSSPSWTHPPGLTTVLADLGFRYCADLHGSITSEVALGPTDSRILLPRTDIAGEPGGVGILEASTRRGLNPEDSVQAIAEAICQSKQDVAIAYDHPYFAGVEALPLLERLIEVLIRRRIDFVTVAQAIL